MVYLAIQLEDPSLIPKLEKALESIDIKSFSNYEPNKNGIYAMATEPQYLVDLQQFSDEEIEEEFHNRNL